MKKQETSISFLEQFLPHGTFEQIAPFFRSHTIHLTLTHERKSVLGDYRHPYADTKYHRISINATLNPYSFLITLLHELAHLYTFEHFGNRVAPHGKEWKTQFRHILIPFMGKRYFPADVEKALFAYLHNPSASTCTDAQLYKSLYKYDEHKPGFKLVDDLSVNQCFETEDGELYQKLEKLRTRTRCRNLGNGKVYFFQGIVEVRARARRRLALH
ncbi:MAG: SprT-like domain-containing protein [Bacteroidota bacterium]